MYCLAVSIFYSAMVDKAMKQGDATNELKVTKDKL